MSGVDRGSGDKRLCEGKGSDVGGKNETGDKRERKGEPRSRQANGSGGAPKKPLAASNAPSTKAVGTRGAAKKNSTERKDAKEKVLAKRLHPNAEPVKPMALSFDAEADLKALQAVFGLCLPTPQQSSSPHTSSKATLDRTQNSATKFEQTPSTESVRSDSLRSEGLSALGMVWFPSDPDVPKNLLPQGLKMSLKLDLSDFKINGLGTLPTPHLQVLNGDLDDLVASTIARKFHVKWKELVERQGAGGGGIKQSSSAELLNRAKATDSPKLARPAAESAESLSSHPSSASSFPPSGTPLLGVFRPLYSTFSWLDANFVAFLLEAAQKKQLRREGPWESAEQAKLEKALIYFGQVVDPKLRWQQIASAVGTRGPKQCAQRALECKHSLQIRPDNSFVKGPQKDHPSDSICDPDSEPSSPSNPDVDSDSNSESESETESNAVSNAESERDEGRRRKAAPPTTAQALVGDSQNSIYTQVITLKEIETANVGVFSAARLWLTVQCGRCMKKVTFPELDVGVSGRSYTFAEECQNCHSNLAMALTPAVAFGSSSSIFSAQLSNAFVADVLPSDYRAACFVCNTIVKFPQLFTGVKSSQYCRHCHTRTSLTFAQIDITGAQANADSQTAQSLATARKTREEKPTRYQVGVPLPHTGTCKHYKKSHRWFRFPCCKKAFPCDTCHNVNSDHFSELATRQICGFCSREQSTQAASCVCGGQLGPPKHTSHWEGGKGCRNQVTMSRKDARKHKRPSK